MRPAPNVWDDIFLGGGRANVPPREETAALARPAARRRPPLKPGAGRGIEERPMRCGPNNLRKTTRYPLS